MNAETAQQKSKSNQQKIRSKTLLSLWLRLLACESIVEQQLRTKLRESFSITLPQFDVLAELERFDKPLSMTELSKNLMVSNGNVTGVVDRLVKENFVKRIPSEYDKRVYLIELTENGKIAFDDISTQHEQWIRDMFEDMTLNDIDMMLKLLTKTYIQLKQNRENY